ncbi:MAG: biopolymer transporter Tol [Ignavibacteria bacterium]|nr:biopolymer transporter Tol [Ignavibacteria bacterium]
MKLKYLVILILFLSVNISFAQFGQNKVQYKNSQWFFIQTKHFDIYFSNGGERIAEFTAASAENALEKLQSDMNYRINNRITLIVYNSHNDFQETNVTDEYTGQGVGGFTEPFKNRVVFPFEGSYKKFDHVIYHELVHAVMQDMFYGGSIQNIITKGITLQLPHWFMEGSAEFLSQGWETNTDMFIRNAIISESLPNINQLTGYLGYRGGQSVFKYIADTYGRQKIGELMNKIQSLGSFEGALKASIGISTEELSERWKKSLKKEYWPDIAVKDDPDEFSKRLTNNKKDGGFYNMSPAFSPQGDKIAFLSDRDIYLDLYIMDATDGKVIKKVVESGKATDFEELNLLHPSLTWAPDNKRIALSSKNKGYDVITIIDTETEESFDLPFIFPGIESVSWSYSGDKITFNAHNSMQSDIYVYDLKSETLDNLTSDIFSDFDPSWSPDGTKIFFSSDRGEPESRYHINDLMIFDHNFKQLDLYVIDFESREIERITNWEFSNEKSVVVSPEGNEILFVSDKNGINNIYKKSLVKTENLSKNSLADLPAYPITNSLSEINQLSISNDGKKLAFTSLYNLGYNIFTLNNPFEMKLNVDSLQLTTYMKQLVKNKFGNQEIFKDEKNVNEQDSIKVAASADSVKNQQKRIFTGQYTSGKEEADTNKTDYSKYVFGNVNQTVDSSRIINRQLLFTEKLDNSGNFLVNKYKISFSPDLVYANAGYSTLYGLLGTTILSFSDVLGNHRLIGITSLQIDVKNSDYGLAYYYLENRLDFGIEAFHTARFLYRFGLFGSELYRFRNFGAVVSASYPFDRFYRMDASLSLMSVTSENLDNIFVPSEKTTFVVPSISFVHDNVMWGYTSPIEGSRYNFTIFGNPGISNKRQSFYSLVWDYRKYFRFWFDNGFAFRLSGGFSGGGNPQRFFMGGIDNWINRNFATQDIPVTNASDFAFLSPAMPLRGYDYAEKIASRYSLLNLELRMPLIRFLLTGPLPIFFQNILGVAFIDAGAAWDNSDALKLFKKDQFDNTVTQDLLIGTGVGLRLYFIFLWRFDVAWKYNLDGFSTPRYYISIGLDF